MKKMRILGALLLISMMFVLIGCSAEANNKENVSTKTGEQLITSDDLNQIVLEKKSGYVYIGRPTCDECKEFKPILDKTIKDKHLVYYFNTDKNRDTELYDTLIALFSVESIPLLLEIEDGQEIQRLEYTTDENKINEFFGNEE